MCLVSKKKKKSSQSKSSKFLGFRTEYRPRRDIKWFLLSLDSSLGQHCQLLTLGVGGGGRGEPAPASPTRTWLFAILQAASPGRRAPAASHLRHAAAPCLPTFQLSIWHFCHLKMVEHQPLYTVQLNFYWLRSWLEDPLWEKGIVAKSKEHTLSWGWGLHPSLRWSRSEGLGPLRQQAGWDREVDQHAKLRLGREKQRMGPRHGRDTILVQPARKGCSKVWKLPWLEKCELWFELCWETGSDEQEVCAEVSESLSCGITRKRRGPRGPSICERTPLADSGVSPGWEKGGWACVTSQPEKCLAFPFLPRKKQEKNSRGG